jgi:CheY-like chemotaxis protein
VDLISLVEDTATTLVLGDRLAMHKFHAATASSSAVDAPAIQDKATHSQPLPVILDLRNTSGLSFNTEVGSWRRIVMNLLGNSLKYTTKGSILVGLDIRTSSRQSLYTHVAELRVQDTGRGISDNFLKHRLYTPFAQENNLSVGAGLGLSLVKQMVTALRGTIRVESEVGTGTEVVVRIPLKVVSSAPENVATGLPKSLKIPHASTFYICGPLTASDVHASTWERTRQVLSTTLVEWFELRPSAGDKADFTVLPLSTLLAGKRQYDVAGTKLLVVDLEQSLRHEHGASVAHAQSARILSPMGPRTIGIALRKLFDINDRLESTSTSTSGTVSTSPKSTMLSVPLIDEQRIVVARPRPLTKSRSDKDSVSLNVSAPDVATEKAILLVDDNDINLRLLLATVTRLEKATPSRYITASNGKEALERYIEAVDAGVRVTTVFMDISMPVMNGIQSTRAIRAFEKSRGVSDALRAKVIALTGLASVESRAEIADSGADIYLCKPASVNAIREALGDAMV